MLQMEKDNLHFKKEHATTYIWEKYSIGTSSYLPT